MPAQIQDDACTRGRGDAAVERVNKKSRCRFLMMPRPLTHSAGRATFSLDDMPRPTPMAWRDWHFRKVTTAPAAATPRFRHEMPAHVAAKHRWRRTAPGAARITTNFYHTASFIFSMILRQHICRHDGAPASRYFQADFLIFLDDISPSIPQFQPLYLVYEILLYFHEKLILRAI